MKKLNRFLSLSLLAGALSGCDYLLSDSVKANAERYAAGYARRFLGWNSAVVECMGRDSDNNGYVTCSVAERAGTPVRQLECPAVWVLESSTSCREYRLRTLDIRGGGVQ